MLLGTNEGIWQPPNVIACDWDIDHHFQQAGIWYDGGLSPYSDYENSGLVILFMCT